jgi:hypothetical protein
VAADGQTTYRKREESGKAAMQLVKECISKASSASERSSGDSVDISSPPTSARLTGMCVGSHQDVLKLYAMSKIDIWTPWLQSASIKRLMLAQELVRLSILEHITLHNPAIQPQALLTHTP